MKKINTIGVIGAGTMGSALTQKFAQEGFNVILVDREMRFVNSGLEKIKTTLKEGVERKIFSAEEVNEILKKITGSDSLYVLSECDIIIEAIFEDFNIKSDLFKNIDKIVNTKTIIATNTSSFSVNELSSCVSHPERFIGMHYFYHAAKNRLVEIVPGQKTSDETVKVMKLFASLSGKDAITCKDAYGFVVNRFFVPWLNEACRILEEGISTPAEIDKICEKTFSIGMGPFALMNATGIPIAYHAQKTLERFGDLYKCSDLLKTQAEINKPWEIENINDLNSINETFQKISDRMFGIVFLVCSQILEEEICTSTEINRGAKIGLKWRKGPIDLMKKTGKDRVNNLVQYYIDKYDLHIPKTIDENYWQMEYVKLEKTGNNALITISRPEDMNALNEDLMYQLSQKFDEAESDNDVKKIFITGEGKAFVAGADIKFFIDNIKSNSINKIKSFTEFGQSVFEKIDKSKKTIIGIVNGLTLGGGFELALCCDVILSVPKSVFAFPETGIGIYPGLGGTQRTQKRIGKGLTKYLIYTGDFINAFDAEKIGIVDGVIQPDDIAEMIEGKKQIPQLKSSKINLDGKYTDIERLLDYFSLNELLFDGFSNSMIPKETSDKIIKKIKYKAPIALKYSEKLIDENKGCKTELDHLEKIFSTSDALLGLSSIGKKVEYQGM